MTYNDQDFKVLTKAVKNYFPGCTVDSYMPGTIKLYHLMDNKGFTITPHRLNKQEFCVFLDGMVTAVERKGIEQLKETISK